MLVNLMTHTVIVSIPGIVPTWSHVKINGFCNTFIKQSLNEITE